MYVVYLHVSTLSFLTDSQCSLCAVLTKHVLCIISPRQEPRLLTPSVVVLTLFRIGFTSSFPTAAPEIDLAI